ncbi:hypothetical protein B0H66DRAFT_629122 [Apodospora peruviana]|uniref:Uncharacterized protein n=1 Tax=Apodospora peruviana TaxID=516989 RepID=A0AAE0HUY6_9PEZI|nr:hypothetical protein B0H66DRAFT_629122 [Apodospora peruviana]
MLLKVIFSAAFLALSVNAVAIARAPGKSFKFQVENNKGKYFLGEAGVATQDETKALVCELAADVLKCAGKGFPDFKAGDMLKLAPAATGAGSAGWSVDASDNIVWAAKPKVQFSIGINGASDVYAEVCPHHWQSNEHGTAKAVYVTV